MQILKLETFLLKSKASTFWHSPQSLWFTGHEYQSVFIADLLAMLNRSNVLPKKIELINLENYSYTQIIAQLEQSFLGESCFYWLGDIGYKNDKKVKLLQTYLSTYHGQHTILGFVSSSLGEKIAMSGTLISLDVRITTALFISILRVLGYSRLAQKPSLVKQLCAMLGSITLDQVAILGKHLSVMSSASAQEYTHYVHMLVKPTASLQKLSSYFFRKQGSAFYALWIDLEPTYAPMFWLTFWSSQIWQASYVMRYMKQKNYSAAKQIGYRLPRNFIQQSMNLITTDELMRAHDFLYQADYALKTGSSFCVFDLLFTNFFSGDFSS